MAVGTPVAVNFANVFMEGLRDECHKIMKGFMTENQQPGYAILTIFYFYGMGMKYPSNTSSDFVTGMPQITA